MFLQVKADAVKWQSGGVAEWLKAADCKSARVAYVGSNPTPTTIVYKCGVCRCTVTFGVAHAVRNQSAG